MTDKLRDAAQQAPMAYYALVIKADSGYESTTEGRCTADQYGAAMAALHGTAALAQQDAQKKHKPLFAEMIAQHPGLAEELAQQDAQAVPTQRQYEMALRQWDHWKSYALELQAKLVKYEGGSPMVLNAAPTPPAQRVMLTDEEIEQASVKGDGTHSGFARAVIEAYERKNGIK